MTSQPGNDRRLRHIVLVGLMGAGKSAVGRELAQRLTLAFHDTDTAIEHRRGISIAEIFATDGEPAFRALEWREVEGLADRRPSVVAVGGGLFVGERNVGAVRASAFCVWLRARVATLLARVGRRPGAARPLLAGDDPEGRLHALLAARRDWYERADLVVDVDSLSVSEVCALIEKRLPGLESCG